MVQATEATGASGPTELRPDSPLGTGPFHAALREAIRQRGLTLERLRSHLARRGVSVALSTLSDWQQGHRRPGSPNSLRALSALEEILGLPGESLVGLLLAPVGAGVPPLRPVRGLDERSGVIAALLDGLPSARDNGLEMLDIHDKVRVDANRQAWLLTSRRVARARRDGVDRYVLRHFGDAGCDIDEVRVRAKQNCRLGRVRRHRDPPVLVAELLFGEALSAGQTWVFENQVVDRTTPETTSHAHGFADPHRQYLVELRFDSRALPVDCHAFAQPGLYDVRRRTADLTLNSHHAVHLLVSGVSAGLVGIGWSWPDAARPDAPALSLPPPG